MESTRASGIVLVLAAASLLLAACDEGSGPEAAPAERMLPVTVTVVHPETVDVSSDFAGRARSAREVEVRARVSGILEERLYDEGQSVDRGAGLFRIDPEPFEIALRRAVAERDRAQAELDQARREWARISSLFDKSAVSERDRDRARAALELAEASLAQNETGVSQAQLDISYTNVEAPIAGVTGLEALPDGSLIERGTLLTTITQLDPIHVHFSLPESDAAAQRVARRAMVADNANHRRAATLVLPDGSEYGAPGEVDFTASSIDPRTGTVSARAVFPNPEQQVRPGQFVRVRIEMERLEEVFLIDPAAVGEGRDGPRVFVVNGEETARARPVRLGPVVDGRQVVIEGLQSGDRLVVNGQVALRDGAPVSVERADESGGR